jgi:hypothetical protein
MSNENKENNNDDLKVFTFRNIPEEVNKNWKLAAAIEGITKEELGAKWLKQSCDNYFIALAKSGINLGMPKNEPIEYHGTVERESIDDENDEMLNNNDVEITAETLKES